MGAAALTGDGMPVLPSRPGLGAGSDAPGSLEIPRMQVPMGDLRNAAD